ncbi:MAG: AIM24 family protein [Fimbriimonadaceae bacterium]
MQYEIQGELAQTAHLTMNQGESSWASKGSIVAIEPGIDWNLKVPGGVGGSVSRALSGEGIALTFIEARENERKVILAANAPGKMIDWDLSEGAVMTTRGSFTAAFGVDIRIDISVARRAGAALFGGAGLFLQKVSGQGTVLIQGSGDFVRIRLEPGETILVSTGNLAAFSDSVDYSIQGISGCRRIFFGGEGLFMTRLTGPGTVLLQSLKRNIAGGAAMG